MSDDTRQARIEAARIAAAVGEIFQGDDPVIGYFTVRSRMGAALQAADSIGRERVSVAAEAAIESARELLLMLHLEVMTGATLTTPAVTAMMTELDTAIFAWDVAVAAPAERGDETGGAETTLAFPVRAEDYVTGPEMPGVVGDGQAFFLSEDTYLAADAAAAPAVGVTVPAEMLLKWRQVVNFSIQHITDEDWQSRLNRVMQEMSEVTRDIRHELSARWHEQRKTGGSDAGHVMIPAKPEGWKP